MKCQHCGTELENKRAKNCPVCSEIKQEANRRGTYAFVMEAMSEAQAAGMTGEQVREAARSAHQAGNAERNSWMDSFRAQQAKARQEKAEARKNWNVNRLDEEQMADRDEVQNQGFGCTQPEW